MRYGPSLPATVAYLDEARRQSAPVKHRAARLLAPAPGERLLDIGCGTGEDVRRWAEDVAPSGSVVGLDNDPDLVDEARRRNDDARLPVRFVVGEATALPFEDAYFDGCHAERVVQHLTAPAPVLAEMHRVLRPGGRLVVTDVDWDTWAVASAYPEVTRRIVHHACDTHANGWAGRELFERLVAAGFSDVRAEAQAVVGTDRHIANRLFAFEPAARAAAATGAITSAECATWLDDLDARAQAGTFFNAITLVTVLGRRA